MIGERVTHEGEQDIVMPPGVVRGEEVQCDRDVRTDVLNVDGLDMNVGDDGSLVVAVRRSSTTGGGRGGIGEGCSIRAAAARASSERTVVVRCSSSSSAVAARTRTQAV
jgi:hypothetical protein